MLFSSNCWLLLLLVVVVGSVLEIVVSVFDGIDDFVSGLVFGWFIDVL